jgi:hypothetical protein
MKCNMSMKYGSEQHRYLKRLLQLNPKLTVGEAIYRLELLVAYLEGSK